MSNRTKLEETRQSVFQAFVWQARYMCSRLQSRLSWAK